MATTQGPTTTVQPGTSLSFYGKLALVILLTVGLSEIIPELVNWILVLILVGLLLSHYKQFNFLTQALGSVGR